MPNTDGEILVQQDDVGNYGTYYVTINAFNDYGTCEVTLGKV